MFNGELIGMSFKKETEKIVLLEVKGLIHIDVKFRTKIDFVKKVLCYGIRFSSPWWCTHVSRVSANKAYKKIVYKDFQLF